MFYVIACGLSLWNVNACRFCLFSSSAFRRFCRYLPFSCHHHITGCTSLHLKKLAKCCWKYIWDRHNNIEYNLSAMQLTQFTVYLRTAAVIKFSESVNSACLLVSNLCIAYDKIECVDGAFAETVCGLILVCLSLYSCVWVWYILFIGLVNKWSVLDCMSVALQTHSVLMTVNVNLHILNLVPPTASGTWGDQIPKCVLSLVWSTSSLLLPSRTQFIPQGWKK